MNKNTGMVIGVVVVLALVIIGAMYMPMDSKKETLTTENAPTAEEKALMEKEVMVNANMMQDASKGERGMVDTPDTMMQAGSYEAYSADKIARAETGDVVLFFHASWCPSCRGLNSNIESNLKSIPAGVTILKADYDKEVELKKKYGVTTQHTLVQVDAAGTMLKKWSGGATLDTILSNIQ